MSWDSEANHMVAVIPEEMAINDEVLDIAGEELFEHAEIPASGRSQVEMEFKLRRACDELLANFAFGS